MTDPDGNVTRFGYDDRGNVVSMTDPLGHTETRTYDDQGRLASITNRDGQKRVLGYDTQGRLAQETWYTADGVTVTDVQTYTYDAQGRLQTATNYAGSYTFTYDDRGRLVRVDEPFGVWLAFGYDTFGHRTLVADSFGGSTASTYDKTGDLTDRSFSQDGTLVADLAQTFNDQGQLTGQARTSPGGVEIDTQYRYDFAGRVADILDQSGGTTLAEFASAFDNAGDLSSDTDNGEAQQFAYDKQGEETSDGTGGAVQSFDGNGNRTTPGYVTGADNQLLSDGTWNYSYDADGNETAKVNIATGESWRYGYDARDHLVHAEERAADGTLEVSVDYKYDLFGNRLEKDVWEAALGLAVTKFAYDGWDPSRGSPVGNENWDVWADLNADGSLQTHYLRTDAIDAVFARIGASGSPEWYLTDRLGSIRDVLSAAGQAEDAIAYDGYGNIIKETNPAARGRYTWTGREFDVETDLQYNRARYDDPTMGRWISQDPMGFDAGDSNLYRYVTNKPVQLSDPSGLQAGDAPQVPGGKRDEDAFIKAALASGVSQADIDLLLKIAKTTPKDSVGWGLRDHQVCFDWVTRFKNHLDAALKKRPGEMSGSVVISGINSGKVTIFDVPYGAQGNTPSDVSFRQKILPYLLDFLNSGGPARSGSTNGLPLPPPAAPNAMAMKLLSQDHTTFRLTLRDGTVWYIDMGVIQRIFGKGSDINDLNVGPWVVTPANRIPEGWSATQRWGVPSPNAFKDPT